MKLIYRIAYYLGGFTVGLILLFFFLGGKKTSCDYGLDARTLKDIRIKERFFTEKTLQTLAANKLDTSAITILLQKGDVLFKESNTKPDSCKIYVIVGNVSDKKLKVTAENCNKKATILKTEVLSN